MADNNINPRCLAPHYVAGFSISWDSIRRRRHRCPPHWVSNALRSSCINPDIWNNFPVWTCIQEESHIFSIYLDHNRIIMRGFDHHTTLRIATPRCYTPLAHSPRKSQTSSNRRIALGLFHNPPVYLQLSFFRIPSKNRL